MRQKSTLNPSFKIKYHKNNAKYSFNANDSGSWNSNGYGNNNSSANLENKSKPNFCS